MEGLLQVAAHWVGLAAEAIAILVIALGLVEASVAMLRTLIHRRTSDAEQRDVWLGFARWLVAGLTFQLAADIVRTTISPTWEDIGRIAAIAAIRTFLTFFLDRDIEAMRAQKDDEAER